MCWSKWERLIEEERAAEEPRLVELPAEPEVDDEPTPLEAEERELVEA
jgi:hypothetical protein